MATPEYRRLNGSGVEGCFFTTEYTEFHGGCTE